MARRLLTFTAATAFTLASGLALAQSLNDGPKYPNMESHKQYKDARNLDHNNPSPRYAVTGTASAPRARTVHRNTRYPVRASHRGGAAATHG